LRRTTDAGDRSETIDSLVVARVEGQTRRMDRAAPVSALPPVPADEVDLSLIDWCLQLSVRERLRTASESAATLERLARAAARNR
jgi:hypothetical protein